MVANSHNLFPLPYWAPALWRVPMPLQNINDAYARVVPMPQASTIAWRSDFLQYLRQATSIASPALRPPGETADAR
jgi:hypothetical protein